MNDMMARVTGRSRSLIAIGVTFIAAGICLNEWTLAAVFSSDGIIVDSHRIIIWIIDVFLVCMGGMIFLLRRSMTKENMLVMVGLCFIAGSFLFSNRYLPALMKMDMNSIHRGLVNVLDFYLFCTGLLTIIYRRFVSRLWESKGILLISVYNVIWIIGFLSLLLLFDLSLAYLELKSLAIRSGEFNPAEAHLTKDDQLGWKLKPNSRVKFKGAEGHELEYVIDNDGFRKIENMRNPRFSVYFFGDSFTFGHGVSNKDTFPNIIKKRYLKEDINIYNAAVGAYGIVQMFQRFLNTENRIKPGDLIVFTPLSDDIQRNIKDFYFPYFHYVSQRILFDSYPFFEKGVIRSHAMEKNFSNTIKVLIFGAPVTGALWYSLYTRKIPYTTQEAREMLQIIKSRTESRGARFALFFLPETGECLNGRYLVDISEFDYFDIRHFFPSDESALDTLRTSKDNGHWKVQGHEIAARAVVETLRTHNILSAEDLRPEYRSSLSE